jgi:tRNA U34 5-methylaminomethyl-2-thiouridine-forming methyltransferase MnmC
MIGGGRRRTEVEVTMEDGFVPGSSGDAWTHEFMAHLRRRSSGGPNAGEALAAQST